MARRGSKPEFAVIGLGRFGTSLALSLIARGYTVLGIDHNREIVQRLADEITQTVALDATDEDALRAVDIKAFDTVIVSIGDSFESNIMATVILKSLGVRRVISKAATERQRTILLAVGADQVVLPEVESAQRLSLFITSPWLLDNVAFGTGHSITEVHAAPSVVGKMLQELALRQRFGVTVLAIRHGDEMIVSPPADYTFAAGDIMAVLGTDAQISQLMDWLT
jgi:trk system potassium uptake protein TrkA